MEMRIIEDKISREDLKQIAEKQFGDLVKAVVDIKQEIIVVGGEFHADGEAKLIEEKNSKREDVWGINIYPEKEKEEFVEFDSLINIKPSFGNRSRNVEDSKIREKIKSIVNNLVSNE